MITDGGTGWGRASSSQVPATWESQSDVSPGVTFWAFEQGLPGTVEFSVKSGDVEVFHYYTGNPSQQGDGTCSGRFEHGGGTVSFEIISSVDPNHGQYALGWGSMVDDTDPTHFTITPASPADPSFSGGQTLDEGTSGFPGAAGSFGSPGVSLAFSDEDAVQPGHGGGVAQDGTVWGWWLVKESQDPAVGTIGDGHPRPAGFTDTYNTGQAHLLVIREPIQQSSPGYSPGSNWGTYSFPDEQIALTQGFYTSQDDANPSTFEVLNTLLGTGDEVGGSFTLTNDVAFTDDGFGDTIIWFHSRQGVTRGQGTFYEYKGVPLRQGALRLMTDSGWLTVGNARQSLATEGWNPPNNFTGDNWDDPGVSQGVLRLVTDDVGWSEEKPPGYYGEYPLYLRTDNGWEVVAFLIPQSFPFGSTW